MSQTLPDYDKKYAALRKTFQKLSKVQRAAFIRMLPPEEAAIVRYSWSFWARDEQLPPEGQWGVWLILSGRGFGKTRTGAEWLIQRARDGYMNHAIIGQTVADVRDVIIRGESGILACSPPWFRPRHFPSKRLLQWPNGAESHTYSGDEPDQLRGPQHDSVLCDELAKFQYPQECLDQLQFGLRLSANPQLVITTTPRPLPVIKDLIDESNAEHNRGNVRIVIRSTYDNIENLSTQFTKNVIKKYEGTRLGEQEIHAKMLGDTPGAIWMQAVIDKLRLTLIPCDMVRIVVAVDPEASSGEDAAETGIIVCGLGTDSHGYVLADYTVRGTPNEWGLEVCKAFYDLQADLVVAEKNNGGDMVEYVISSVSLMEDARKRAKKSAIPARAVPVKLVWASRGKQARAEPISLLYQQGIIHHIGNFAMLESQMTVWVPGKSASPDRLDALVWGMTELFYGDGEDEYVVFDQHVSTGAY